MLSTSELQIVLWNVIFNIVLLQSLILSVNMVSAFLYDHVAPLRRSVHTYKLRFQVPALPA